MFERVCLGYRHCEIVQTKHLLTFIIVGIIVDHWGRVKLDIV